MNVKKCEKCGLKYDEEVSVHVCPKPPKPVKKKEEAEKKEEKDG